MKRHLRAVLLAVPVTFGLHWDTLLHFSAGYISANIAQVAVKGCGFSSTDAYLAGLGVAVAAATTKESADPVWDWGDWTSTVLGGGVAVTINF